MANRMCPICFGKVPRSRIVAHSDAVDCPHCGRALELSRPSRLLSSFIGLAAAWLVFYWISRATAAAQDLREWFLPAVAAIITFGVISPLFLLLNSDLVVKPDAPAEPAPALAHSHGHASTPHH
jgi:hypothetical protein